MSDQSPTEDGPAGTPKTTPAPEHMSSTVSLQGQVLIAMPPPAMVDRRFERSVIYVCSHSEQGAMGLVINKPAEGLSFGDLLERLSITATAPDACRLQIHAGGPVETNRGFVLHSADYPATQPICDGVGLTATLDILKAMAQGNGPVQSLLALGYAGWGPGQLEGEMKANGWLYGPADEDLLFGTPCSAKWDKAMAALGISPSLLSNVQGTA